MRFILLVFIFILVSCSSNSNLEKRGINEIYIPSKVSKYLLPEIPDWVNFSESSQCKRISPIKFLNFENLYKSFGLSYEQIVQMQLGLNKNFENAKSKLRNKKASIQLEEMVFFQTKDEVEGDIKFFREPSIKRVHLVWVDPVLRDKNKMKKLKSLMQSDDFFNGHPVFVSSCLGQAELQQFSNNNGWGDIDIRFVSSEMFGPFDSKNKYIPEFMVNVSELMKNKNLYFYDLGGRRPNIKGNFNIIKR